MSYPVSIMGITIGTCSRYDYDVSLKAYYDFVPYTAFKEIIPAGNVLGMWHDGDIYVEDIEGNTLYNEPPNEWFPEILRAHEQSKVK